MSIIFVLLPLSLLLGGLFLFAYSWSVRSGQFEDLKTPSLRVLNDEELHKGEQGGTES